MISHLGIVGVGPAERFIFDFADRVNLLTGDNGLGKTFALDIAWFALTHTWAGRDAWVSPSHKGEARIEWKLKGSGPGEQAGSSVFDWDSRTWSISSVQPTDSLVLYAKIDGGFSAWDPVRTRQRPSISASGSRTGSVFEQPSQGRGDYHFTPGELWDGVPLQEGRPATNGLIRDWNTWQLQKNGAIEILKGVLEVLSPGRGEVLRMGQPTRVSLDDPRDIPTLVLPYGVVPVVFASAGVKRIIAFAYLMVWAWEEHRKISALMRRPPARRLVVIVDELEAHLHPRWQRRILPALRLVAKELSPEIRVQIISSTHAPLVLASAEPWFTEDTDQLFQFDAQDGRVSVRQGLWARQGDAVGWLTSEVFGLEQARSVEAESAIEAAEAFMRGDTRSLPKGLKTRAAIDAELRRVIPGDDPFWPRWIVHAHAPRRAAKRRE